MGRRLVDVAKLSTFFIFSLSLTFNRHPRHLH